MALPIYGQKYPKSCWAASMRMMLADRGTNVADDDAIASATLDNGFLIAGLDPNATKCLRHWGFVPLAPQTFTEAGIVELVRQRGPIWAACDVRLPGYSAARPHVRVIAGVRDQQSPLALVIHDPSPIGRGARYDETYADFVAKNEMLGAGEARQPRPVYFAYLS